jgi:excisionase family DNA binding protein
MSKLLTTKEVCERLSLKNTDIVTWLVQRELLPRTRLGPKTFRYELEDVDHLLEMARTKGVCLTQKP